MIEFISSKETSSKWTYPFITKIEFMFYFSHYFTNYNTHCDFRAFQLATLIPILSRNLRIYLYAIGVLCSTQCIQIARVYSYKLH